MEGGGVGGEGCLAIFVLKGGRGVWQVVEALGTWSFPQSVSFPPQPQCR